MTYVDGINALELVWWPFLGAVLFLKSRRSTAARQKLGLIAACFLVLFGVSDGIELWTKAWWKPWWLMVWKGICLIAMALCAVFARRTSSGH